MNNQKPCNILYFSSFGDTGRGGQESLFYLVSNLDRRKFCPHVVVPTEDVLAMRLKMCGIQVSIIKLPKILDWSILKKILVFNPIAKRYKPVKVIDKLKRFYLIHTNHFFNKLLSCSCYFLP